MRFSLRASLACAAIFLATSVVADDAALRREAAAGLKKACRFFNETVSTEGGYLWRYSEDLAVREGEGKANATTVWVQPPGTPRSHGPARCLQAPATFSTSMRPRSSGHCLVAGYCGPRLGLSHRVDEKERARTAYRVDRPLVGMSQRYTSTLDDDTTKGPCGF